MKEPQDRAFEGRSGFQEAVLSVLALARREIWLLDPGFADWPIHDATGARALQSALARGARLKVLVGNPDFLQRQADRFLRLQRLHSARIQIRVFPESLLLEESVLLADDQHLVRKPHHDSRMGRLVIAMPSATDGQRKRLGAIWDESGDAMPATTLGL
jgi:hypothetical protein